MGFWAKDELNKEQWYYSPKDLMRIAGNYEAYIPDESKMNQIFWMRNWRRLIEDKVDFDTAVKSLGFRKQKFIGLIIRGLTNHELRRAGFYSIGKFRWQVFDELASYLNGGERN